MQSQSLDHGRAWYPPFCGGAGGSPYTSPLDHGAAARRVLPERDAPYWLQGFGRCATSFFTAAAMRSYCVTFWRHSSGTLSRPCTAALTPWRQRKKEREIHSACDMLRTRRGQGSCARIAWPRGGGPTMALPAFSVLFSDSLATASLQLPCRPQNHVPRQTCCASSSRRRP